MIRRGDIGRNNKVCIGFGDNGRHNVELQADSAPRRETRQNGELCNVGTEEMRTHYPYDDEAEL